MNRIIVYSVSFNPDYYDAKKVARMSFDEAVHFFECEDTLNCCHTEIMTIDPREIGEIKIMQDGIISGDTTDAMLVWIKVD